MLDENSAVGKAGFGTNPLNRKDSSPSGRFWPRFYGGLIRIRLNLVYCDSCCRLEPGFVFPETRNSLPSVALGEKDPYIFFFPMGEQSDCALGNQILTDTIPLTLQLEPGRGRDIPGTGKGVPTLDSVPTTPGNMESAVCLHEEPVNSWKYK